MLQLGQRLGDFEILRLLGKGGMGEVYEALQLHPPRPVALKILAPWLSSNPEALERFWREAAVPAELDHPCIVRIISTGVTEDGTAYYTMHLVRGISLAALIKRTNETLPSTAALATTPPDETPTSAYNGFRSPQVVQEPGSGEPPPSVLEAYRTDRYRFLARVGASAARALSDAHQRGYLHRDIKPSNLMIDHHDQVYLVDFGLTKALDPGAKGTQVGVIRGTPWYMSPEQARGEVIDGRSDLYSLGVTLYELASEGRGPFTANRDNSDAVLAQVRAGQFVALRGFAGEIPHRLEEIILKAMHFKPRKRYQHALELAAALEEFTGVSGSSHRPRTHVRPAPRSVVLQWVLLGGLLLLIAAGSAYIGSRRDRRNEPDPEPNPPATLLQVPAPPLHPPKRERPLNTAMPLLDNTHLPRWEHRASGQGKYTVHADFLELQSFAGQGRTRLALDYDEVHQAFEYSVELRQIKPILEGGNRLGIFFGWRPPASERELPPRFFMFELDEILRPLPGGGIVSGRLNLRTTRLDLGTEVRGMLVADRTLPESMATFVPLNKSDGSWHTVRVQVKEPRITLRVDDLPPVELDLPTLRRDPAHQDFQVAGGLGIWVERGIGHFRNAQFTALKPK